MDERDVVRDAGPTRRTLPALPAAQSTATPASFDLVAAAGGAVLVLGRPDGMHVGIHELAHALDHGLGERLLAQHERCDAWRHRLRDMPLHGGMVIADVEGPELFAVASELFFERPMTLMRIDPELFFELVSIYKIDPRTFR